MAEPPLASHGSRFCIGRRELINSGALAAGMLVLQGCATSASRARAAASPPPPLCLPPVKVSENRIIRTLVGLRPYREGGFVVRAEALGTKRLVHNYGHGGAGITLSWGTSKLATELGLPGHKGPVAVLGAGVVGLTTARLVQEAGFPVTLYAQALPPDTTSNIAGGQWLPSSHYEPHAVTPQWQEQLRAATDYAYRRYQLMVGEDYGVRWVTQYFEAAPRPPGSPKRVRTSNTQPDWRQLGKGQHPFPFDEVRQHQLMMVEPNRFLRQLMRDIQIAGGRIMVRSFASPVEVASLPEQLIFNCTGLGARNLFGDQDLRPVRGQLVILVPQPEVEYALAGRFGYMFPRSDGIVLGGTYDMDDWSTVPDPATTQRLITSHSQVFDNFRCGQAG